MRKISFPSIDVGIIPEKKDRFFPVDFADVVDLEYKKEDLTCFYCRDNVTCPHAWDAYNTDGDCLFIK